MAKIKGTLDDFKPDSRLIDERGATPERMGKVVQFERGDTGTVTIRQSTIDRAVKRQTLTIQQGRAAEKLYMHWYRAGMAGTIGSSDMGRIFADNGDFSRLAATEAGQFHWERLKAAIQAIRSALGKAGNCSECIKVLEYVVCREMDFESAGRKIGHASRDWAEKSAILLTRQGLNVLAHEWGID